MRRLVKAMLLAAAIGHRRSPVGVVQSVHPVAQSAGEVITSARLTLDPAYGTAGAPISSAGGVFVAVKKFPL